MLCDHQNVLIHLNIFLFRVIVHSVSCSQQINSIYWVINFWLRKSGDYIVLILSQILYTSGEITYFASNFTIIAYFSYLFS